MFWALQLITRQRLDGAAPQADACPAGRAAAGRRGLVAAARRDMAGSLRPRRLPGRPGAAGAARPHGSRGARTRRCGRGGREPLRRHRPHDGQPRPLAGRPEGDLAGPQPVALPGAGMDVAQARRALPSPPQREPGPPRTDAGHAHAALGSRSHRRLARRTFIHPPRAARLERFRPGQRRTRAARENSTAWPTRDCHEMARRFAPEPPEPEASPGPRSAVRPRRRRHPPVLSLQTVRGSSPKARPSRSRSGRARFRNRRKMRRRKAGSAGRPARSSTAGRSPSCAQTARPPPNICSSGLGIRYMRAADLIERMEQEGILGAPVRNGTRPILRRLPRTRVV